ncbi:olfactory receptor 6F1-like [Phyllobates terribilis]|uniref:olfactory receptor 6F1-like n=1 Tax=Phyllobates terribilis TaxID=111132 RepID=UPI003CCB018B
MVYTTTLAGNTLIIGLILISHPLHCPMYFFLSHLSACDILISTNVLPNTLKVLLSSGIYISIQSCFTQLYFFGASAIVECCLLTVMSYDRYLAICNPLRYSSIMNIRLPYFLAAWSWTMGLVVALINYCFLLEIQFCGSNIIDHFFCDLPPLLKISCSDSSVIELVVSILAIVLGILQCVFVIISYVFIFNSILRISSSAGRCKAFSTCSSHLSVVCIYYGSLIAINIAPSQDYSFNLKKVLSLLNTVVTPLFNPIIYSLRNKDIQEAIFRVMFRRNRLKNKWHQWMVLLPIKQSSDADYGFRLFMMNIFWKENPLVDDLEKENMMTCIFVFTEFHVW